ncbi:hypothetical protein GN956_G16600 [Arapaima gigas]
MEKRGSSSPQSRGRARRTGRRGEQEGSPVMLDSPHTQVHEVPLARSATSEPGYVRWKRMTARLALAFIRGWTELRFAVLPFLSLSSSEEIRAPRSTERFRSCSPRPDRAAPASPGRERRAEIE